MVTFLLAFLPDAALPLVIAGLGLAVMMGFVSLRRAGGFVGILVLTIVLAPFVESLFASLPLWIGVLVILFFAMWAVRTVLEFTLGEHAAGHVIGTAFVATVVLASRILLFPLRLLVRPLR